MIDAAAAIIERDGFHATRISDIAERAGVAIGSFYSYFPSKQAVFTAVIEDSLDRVDRQPPRSDTTATADLTPEQRRAHAIKQVEGAVERYLDRFADQSATLFARLDEALGSHPELVELRRAAHARSADVIAASLCRWQSAGLVDADLDPDHTADALAAMVGHSTRVWMVLGRPHDRTKALETLTRLWIRGIGLDR
ncbi:TetR/AcrR family transcriptional regulator [Rhodococcus sp. LB1]|uniref:TetR/AcrR family transcriptional regulator n=1 Tax=Rhodococcus sp. LB1 TaxID=1807499 RepID=UPI001E501AC5|nr:TetR/AcrR family transcriptional regulator [Rhodococcus sp. LB1]